MLLCYIDESGNTGTNLKDANQPTLVLTSLLIPPEKIKEVENNIRDMSYKYFLAESRNTDFELHGDDIYNGRGRYFKKIPLEKRIKLLNEIVNLAIYNDSIKIGYICIDKQKYFATPHIQQTAFSLLVERIEEHLNGHLDSFCLLIADEQDELEQKLIDDLDHYKQHGTNFGYKTIKVDKIIDSVHFVQSKNNFLMQLTDVLCYIIRKGIEYKKVMRIEWIDDIKALDEQDKSYKTWLSNYNKHKGKKYFCELYQKLEDEKKFLFTKNFPMNS
jgi:hypothetical protein